MKKIDCIGILVPTNKPSIIQMHVVNKDFQPVSDYKTPYNNPPAIFQNMELFIAGDGEIYASTDAEDEYPMISTNFVEDYLKSDRIQSYLIEINENNNAHVQGSDFANIHKYGE